MTLKNLLSFQLGWGCGWGLDEDWMRIRMRIRMTRWGCWRTCSASSASSNPWAHSIIFPRECPHLISPSKNILIDFFTLYCVSPTLDMLPSFSGSTAFKLISVIFALKFLAYCDNFSIRTLCTMTGTGILWAAADKQNLDSGSSTGYDVNPQPYLMQT